MNAKGLREAFPELAACVFGPTCRITALSLSERRSAKLFFPQLSDDIPFQFPLKWQELDCTYTKYLMYVLLLLLALSI
ncbi:hypothetical protein A8A54_18455 [Brucella pseudogrignonensis]|nr:hypothetical protein A8A54_18455 [Brucella pseudogrignonensis]